MIMYKEQMSFVIFSLYGISDGFDEPPCSLSRREHWVIKSKNEENLRLRIYYHAPNREVYLETAA